MNSIPGWLPGGVSALNNKHKSFLAIGLLCHSSTCVSEWRNSKYTEPRKYRSAHLKRLYCFVPFLSPRHYKRTIAAAPRWGTGEILEVHRCKTDWAVRWEGTLMLVFFKFFKNSGTKVCVYVSADGVFALVTDIHQPHVDASLHNISVCTNKCGTLSQWQNVNTHCNSEIDNPMWSIQKKKVRFLM